MSDTDGAGRGADLFEQWLAHHEGRPEDAAPHPEPPAVVEAGDDSSIEPQLPDHNVAAAGVLAALRPEEPGPEPVVEASAPEVSRATPLRPAPLAPQPPSSPVRALPQTIFFKPRGTTRSILGLLLLVFVALSAAAAWWAYQDRSYTSYAIAGVVVVVTGIIWATRTSASPARLTLHGSELEIVRNNSKALFDLAHVEVEMHGKPGGRGWKMLILRRSMSPYVIDSSMVDPGEFTYVVRFFHPEI